MALCPGLPGWKSISILLKQETVSGSGISWSICKSALHSRQVITPAPHHSVFFWPDALPAAQPTASKHWRQTIVSASVDIMTPRCDMFLQWSWAGWWRCWKPGCEWHHWRQQVQDFAAEDWRGTAEAHFEQRLCRRNVIFVQVLHHTYTGVQLIQTNQFGCIINSSMFKKCPIWCPLSLSWNF